MSMSTERFHRCRQRASPCPLRSGSPCILLLRRGEQTCGAREDAPSLGGWPCKREESEGRRRAKVRARDFGARKTKKVRRFEELFARHFCFLSSRERKTSKRRSIPCLARCREKEEARQHFFPRKRLSRRARCSRRAAAPLEPCSAQGRLLFFRRHLPRLFLRLRCPARLVAAFDPDPDPRLPSQTTPPRSSPT